eukprot:Rhum_TRINITY_DN19495_c0_g1::Rhum_TRINITY_DN19495_c0_g1_i1::g.170136::m.170136
MEVPLRVQHDVAPRLEEPLRVVNHLVVVHPGLPARLPHLLEVKVVEMPQNNLHLRHVCVIDGAHRQLRQREVRKRRHLALQENPLLPKVDALRRLELPPAAAHRKRVRLCLDLVARAHHDRLLHVRDALAVRLRTVAQQHHLLQVRRVERERRAHAHLCVVQLRVDELAAVQVLLLRHHVQHVEPGAVQHRVIEHTLLPARLRLLPPLQRHGHAVLQMPVPVDILQQRARRDQLGCRLEVAVEEAAVLSCEGLRRLLRTPDVGYVMPVGQLGRSVVHEGPSTGRCREGATLSSSVTLPRHPEARNILVGVHTRVVQRLDQNLAQRGTRPVKHLRSASPFCLHGTLPRCLTHSPPPAPRLFLQPTSNEVQIL